MEPRRTGKIVAINSKAAGRLNSIGLSQTELDRLLAELDNDSNAASPRRLYARWRFNSPSVQMLLRHSSGTEIPNRVACRNLSCGGASVLHSAYVHTGSLCTLLLPRRGGTPMPCTGKIVRCTHRQGTIHELGVAFDRAIRMREFFSEGTMLDRYTFENVDPSKLVGCLLVVSGSPLQQKSVGALLADTSVRIRSASSCAAALAEELASIDLILCDWKLADGTAESLLLNLRAIGITTPFLISIPDSFKPEKTAEGIAPEGFLRLPLQADMLRRALAEFLLAPVSEDNECGTQESAESRRRKLPETLRQLHQALELNDAIGCYSLCLSLRDSANSLGQEKLAKLGDVAALALGDSLDLKAARPKVIALLAACDSLAARASAG